MRALFVSRNLVGDSLYVSRALYGWYQLHKPAEVHMLTNGDFIAPLYLGMGVPLRLGNQAMLDDMQSGWDFQHVFDVNKAFEYCHQHQCHLAEAYAALLGVPLTPLPLNRHLKPIYFPRPEVLPSEIEQVTRQGVILVSMFSASCSSREGKPANKMLPWECWAVILRYLRTFGMPIRFIGAPKDRAPLDISEEEYMLGIPLNQLALVMQRARLLVTVDNGMSHLGASQETPTFLFYPKCLGLHYILPRGNPNVAYLHMAPTELQPMQAVLAMKPSMSILLQRRGYVGHAESDLERERRTR